MMATTRETLSEWFDIGKSEDAAFMLVMTDQFDHTDYPIFVPEGTDPRKIRDDKLQTPMTGFMECYDLTKPKVPQINNTLTIDFGSWEGPANGC
jgi:hypothetical protein